MKIIEQMAETKYFDSFLEYDIDVGRDPPDKSIYCQSRLLDLISGVIQGTTVNRRVGDQITLTSLQFRFCVSPVSQPNGNLIESVSPVFYLRIIVFSWRGSTLPILGDIISVDDHSDKLGRVNYWNILSPLNHEKKSLRKIWYDNTTCHFITEGNGKNQCHYESVYLPISKFKNVEYKDSASVVNRICMLLISSTCVRLSEAYPKAWPIYLYTRTNFKDI